MKVYTDEQKRRHIYDLQVCLRRIQQENDHPQPLVPDGIFGAETAEAVRAHQRQNGLPVSGQVDRATWDSIFGAYEQLTALDALPTAVRFFPAEGGVLSPGDRGAAVFVLQLLLDGRTAFRYGLPGVAAGLAGQHGLGGTVLYLPQPQRG